MKTMKMIVIDHVDSFI